jgi:protein-disulfide isomerase
MRTQPARFNARALVSLALLTFTIPGCKQRGKEAHATEGAIRADSCSVLKKRVCAVAHEKSPACAAANLLLSATTEASCEANLKEFASVQEKLIEQRKPCDELVSTVCAELGADSAGCRATRDQAVEFLSDYCRTLQKQTDTIVADLKQQEKAKLPLSEAVQAQLAGDDAASIGAPDAKITLVIFSDFQCPFCARAAEVTKQVREKYKDNIRLVFRHLPLPNHPAAKPAAQAALAAHVQGKFWPFHDLLFANQGKLDATSLESYAKEVGLLLPEFRKDASSEDLAKQLTTDMVMASTVAVNGTPTMFINGKRVSNPTDFATVAQEIDAAQNGI